MVDISMGGMQNQRANHRDEHEFDFEDVEKINGTETRMLAFKIFFTSMEICLISHFINRLSRCEKGVNMNDYPTRLAPTLYNAQSINCKILFPSLLKSFFLNVFKYSKYWSNYAYQNALLMIPFKLRGRVGL